MFKTNLFLLFILSQAMAKGQDYVQSKTQQANNERVLTVSWRTGDTISEAERNTYNLFPFLTDKTFYCAQFIERKDNGELLLRVTLKNKSVVREPYTQDHYYRTQALINQKDLKKNLFLNADSTINSDGSRLIMLSPHVGEVIDSTEKMRFGLISMYNKSEFGSARFFETKDKDILLEVKLKNGGTEKKIFSTSRVNSMVITLANDIAKSEQTNAQKPLVTLTLKNGEVLKGRIVEERKAEILFETAYEVDLVNRSEIQTIKKN